MRTLSASVVAALAALALVVGLPVGSASASGGPAGPAVTATPVAATSTDVVSVAVSPTASGVVKEGGDLTASIIVRNGTDSAIDAGVARVYLDRATFSSRSLLQSWFARSPSTTTDALGSFMTSVEVPALAAGKSSSAIPVTIPAATLSLNGSDWGAKAFGVRFSVGDSALTETHSSVVYYPNDSFQATRLAIAVPLTVPESTSGLVSSDALAAYTSPNGLLTQELDAIRGKQVAIGIDPMILASIRILGNTAPPSAVVWLERLESAPNQTFALAYADSDISAVRQSGAATLPAPIDFADSIAAQQKAEPDSYAAPTPGSDAGGSGNGTGNGTDTGTGTDTNGNGTDDAGGRSTGTASPEPSATGTSGATAIPPTSSIPTTQSLLAFAYTQKGVAWPLDDTVATADLGTFASSGFGTTILSSGNVAHSTASTENAAATIGGSKALVSDSVLSGLIRSAVSSGTGEEFATDISRLSAELATLTHERPSDARTLFATVGRDWATTGSKLDETLDAVSALTWTTSTTVSDAMAAEPTATTLTTKKAADSRVDAITKLVDADDSLDRFATALSTPNLVTAKERLRMLALTSLAWRENPEVLGDEIDKVTASVARVVTAVSIVQGSPINILGDRSSLPVIVKNDTDSQAEVDLRVVPSNYSLNVEKKTLAVSIQPNSQSRVTVPVQSVANGKVNLTLFLTSTKGVDISTPTVVPINVRAGWETAITAVFAAAVVLLFGGGIYRSIRRRRKTKETDA